ncbi:uncharacterized protein LOC141660188 [Apium graveolens]|uniref:uncharacterized protein LOC141660188 n=1 Tax=Apium graveolens TaxID=4045 RepID=UPI003D798E34
MELGDRKLDTAKGTPLYGFTGNEVKLFGVIDLPVLFGSPPCQIWEDHYRPSQGDHIYRSLKNEISYGSRGWRDLEEVKLFPADKEQLTKTLQSFADIFAWNPKDMPGIPKQVALHRLNISSEARPVRQKRRVFSAEKQEAIDIEIDRLLEAGFIKEVQFPRWIANAILVKKSNGKWRMCVDYSDVNRDCPKDFYPLPNID